MDDWQNHIVGHGIKPALEFLANPLNFRIHTALQAEAMDGILDTLGWIEEVIENVPTGHLINGHLRVSRAYLRDPLTPVPVRYVELTPVQERVALAIFDHITGLADQDDAKLATLLDQDGPSNDARVNALLADLREKVTPVPLYGAEPTDAHYAPHSAVQEAAVVPNARHRTTHEEEDDGECPIPVAVRYFQLFLTPAQHTGFLADLDALRSRYTTVTPIDTLTAAFAEVLAHA